MGKITEKVLMDYFFFLNYKTQGFCFKRTEKCPIYISTVDSGGGERSNFLSLFFNILSNYSFVA